MNTPLPKNYQSPGSDFSAKSEINSNVFIWEKNGRGYAMQCKTTTGSGVIPPTDTNLFGQGCEIMIVDSGMKFTNSAQDGLAPVWSGIAITKKVSLTSAQILALNTTAVELVAAPSAGYVLDIVSVVGRMNFLTAAYATNTELDIIDTTLGTVLFKDTATLLAAAATKVVKVEPNIASNVGLAVTSAGSVSAKVATGNPATGAGTLDIYITYSIIPL